MIYIGGQHKVFFAAQQPQQLFINRFGCFFVPIDPNMAAPPGPIFLQRFKRVKPAGIQVMDTVLTDKVLEMLLKTRPGIRQSRRPEPAPMRTASACSSACFARTSVSEQIGINFCVTILENIQNHLLDGSRDLQEALNRLHRNLCCFPVGKVKLPCGNTAERHAGKSLRRSQLQAGAVASGKQIPVLLCYTALYNRTHCVQHISGRQVIALSRVMSPCQRAIPG